MYLIFSNWLFFWFILYILNFITFSPLFFLLFTYIIIVIITIYIYFINIPLYYVIKLFSINTLFKLIPISLIFIKNNYSFLIFYKDIFFGFLLLFLYLLFLIISNINPISLYINLINTYLYNDLDNRPYISKTYDKLFKK